ncbi:MAG: L,D-transpeptidase family protein [Candidatus Hydrogenedens sp.]|nr:L,D-transpeptidase family protein [Candidatus Hydrogenedens sp.]
MLYFGLVPAEQRGPVLEYLQREAATCPAPLRPLLIEAAFRNGAANFGYAQLLQLKGSPAVLCLLPECVLGLYPAGAAWSRAGVSPPAVSGLSELHLTLPLPAGTITAHHVPGVGYAITATTGLPVEVNAPEGVSVSVRSQHAAAAALTSEERAVLSSARWKDEVGEALAAWVDVDRQRFFLIENGEAVWQVACATAAAGAGSEAGSQKTPLGWHQVAQKFGEGAPWGQVFRSRAATKEIWKPGDDVTEDMVLTRVLWLDGLEPGKNKGTAASGVNVDSKARFIYIHGTNGEALIGTPSSHGCIRLYNNDVIEAFARLSVGSKVLITGTG